MTSETAAAHVQPVLAEIRQMREDMVTKADLAELNRRVEVLAAHLDGLKTLRHMMLGAFALLVTVLTAVFGFLFTA